MSKQNNRMDLQSLVCESLRLCHCFRECAGGLYHGHAIRVPDGMIDLPVGISSADISSFIEGKRLEILQECDSFLGNIINTSGITIPDMAQHFDVTVSEKDLVREASLLKLPIVALLMREKLMAPSL